MFSIWKKRNNKVVDSKLKHSNSQLENVQVQLDWIKRIQDQVDFANNPEVLPDFQIYFKVELRRYFDY